MPDFGFWAWPEIGLQSYADFLSMLDDSEQEFLDKFPELVWRAGPQSESSNSRDSFIRESKGYSWANVKEVDWSNETSVENDNISLEDHCDYMFLVQTEGNTYANRLKYLLNCHSIVITHELQWIEHYHHLLISTGSNENYIKVKRGFSDLRSTMSKAVRASWQQDQGVGIANNAKRTFRERYLTPAAEACYWRALIRGWASVQGFEPQVWDEDRHGDVMDVDGEKRKPRGTPFETYAITGAVD